MLDIFAPYKWEALFQRWPDILAAFGTTVGISVLALVIALALGIVFGVLSVSVSYTHLIPSESVCHPAKLAHMRLYDLVRSARADAVFMPCYVRGRKCPVACGYAAAVADCAPLVRDRCV